MGLPTEQAHEATVIRNQQSAQHSSTSCIMRHDHQRLAPLSRFHWKACNVWLRCPATPAPGTLGTGGLPGTWNG